MSHPTPAPRPAGAVVEQKRRAYESDVEIAKRIAANESLPMWMRQAAAADGILKIIALRGGEDRSLSAREDW